MRKETQGQNSFGEKIRIKRSCCNNFEVSMRFKMKMNSKFSGNIVWNLGKTQNWESFLAGGSM